MYVSFQRSPGQWSVGTYSPTGRWIHDSDHNSRIHATNRVIFLNGQSFPRFSKSSLTIQELMDYIDSVSPNSENKSKLSRLKNILNFLSNLYIYTNQITEENFLSVKNSGQITWLFYLQTMVDLKLHKVKTKNEIVEI